MSETTEYRRNAAERALAGGALVGAGAGLKSQADSKFKIKNGKVKRNFTIIGPDGLPAGQHTVLEDKMVKPTLMHGFKNKKFTSSHAKFLGTKTAARSIQGAGLGLAIAGGKQFYRGQQNEKFNLKREVVRPLVRADVIEEKIKHRVNKASAEDKLISSKERTRRYLQVGGAIGGTALALRTPEFAGALKHAPKSKILRRAKEIEPQSTKISNSLLAVGSGIGAAGALNSAHMQKLETNQLKANRLKDVNKAAKQQNNDNKKLALGTAAGVGLGVSFPTLQKTPQDSGASTRINTTLNGKHTGHVDINDVRGIARTPGRRYGAKQNQAKLTSKMGKEGFKESHPIEVSRYANGQMVVTNGHHRLHAAEDLGHTSVPIRVRNEPGKAPRSVVPLYRSGRFVRDIVDARKPRQALDEKGRAEMEALAAKDTPKRIQRANKIKSLSEEIPHNLNTPKNKVALAAVTAASAGAYGTHRAHEKKNVSKRDDEFLTQYRNRISPKAEEGYKYLRHGVKHRQFDAAASGALSAGLAGYSIKDFRNKNKTGAALGLLGSAIAGKESYENAHAARAWNAKADKIKQRAYQRERDGQWGQGRNVDVAKSLWVQKGLSVGLPYPKGTIRRAGLRAGHLMRTSTGKTVSVRGSVG